MNVHIQCVGGDGLSSHKSGSLTEGGESGGCSDLVDPDTYQLLIRMLKNNLATRNSRPS